MSPGDVYNAEAVEKSVEDMTIEAARQGFAFATVRAPAAIATPEARTVNLIFTVEEGSAPISSGSTSAATPARATT